MRFTLSTLLAFAILLVSLVLAAPAPAPAPAAVLDKKALGKQRIADAQFKPRKAAELKERTFIPIFGNGNNNNPPKASQGACKALPFLPCTDCCPPGFTCRTLLGFEKRDGVDKRTLFEKRCYKSTGFGFVKREDGTEEYEPEQEY